MKLLAVLAGAALGEVYYAKYRKQADGCTLLEEGVLPTYAPLKVDRQQTVLLFQDHINNDRSGIVEVFARTPEDRAKETATCKPYAATEDHERRRYSLHKTGHPANRIDVVLMGDGYSDEEKDTFLADMHRLAARMFEGPYASWAPLANVWAIHAHGSPFQVRRLDSQLRFVEADGREYAQYVCSSYGALACDFPVVVANDEHYAQAGGELIITSSSPRNGAPVLNHELGHALGLADEGHGGTRTVGPNAAASLAALGWRHWLTNPAADLEQRSTYHVQQQPWLDLAQNPRWQAGFFSDGTYSKFVLEIVLTGADRWNSLSVTLDTRALTWAPQRTDDRMAYAWSGKLPMGHHSLVIQSTYPSTSHVSKTLVSVSLYEIDESKFVVRNSHIAAYPTWSNAYRRTYRPTNHGCLMHNTTAPKLCSVCKEAIWNRVLARVSLIDDVLIGFGTVEVKTPALGQFRSPRVPGEELLVFWYQGTDRRPTAKYTGLFKIPTPAPGDWRVRVELKTPELKQAAHRANIATEKFTIPEPLK